MKKISYLVLMILLMTSCNSTTEYYKWDNIIIDSSQFELRVISTSSFLEGSPIEFKASLIYTGEKSVKFSGGETPMIFIVNKKGETIGNSKGYDLTSTEVQIEKGHLFNETWTIDNLKSGTYYISVDTDWIELDNQIWLGTMYNSNGSTKHTDNGSLQIVEIPFTVE